ncbi:MAG TPA: hypothetical protein DCR35_10340 [Runella sp.]|nr:hypothetical protein [Runella sp.]HAO49661.1 hypothetical protein [Runella sp.]
MMWNIVKRTLFFGGMWVCLACSQPQSATEPDPTSVIVDKWWCAKAGASTTVSAQYFRADGTWEQGAKGGKFNDTGKWALSSDKKKIVLSQVVDYTKKSKTGWEYIISSFSETNLKMEWSSFNVTMDLEPCK